MLLGHPPVDSHKQSMNASQLKNQIAPGEGDMNHKDETKNDVIWFNFEGRDEIETITVSVLFVICSGI